MMCYQPMAFELQTNGFFEGSKDILQRRHMGTTLSARCTSNKVHSSWESNHYLPIRQVQTPNANAK